MGRIVLVTGGARSGKSTYAQAWAEEQPGSRCFIATCPDVDDEMRERIRRHRQERHARGWTTIEEELDLASAIRRAAAHDVALVDCITLWVNNLLFAEGDSDPGAVESDVLARCRETLDAAREHPGTVVFVTNELGLGIVPANALARLYRDIVGRCNQLIAASADGVVLLVCGIPVVVKDVSTARR